MRGRVLRGSYPLIVALTVLSAVGVAHAETAGPTVTGETGFLRMSTPATLRAGEWNLAVSWAKYDYLLAPAPELAPPSRRKYQPPDVDDNELGISLGLGITNRWEVTANLPYAIIRNNAGDRTGYLNGYPETGAFEDRGRGDLRLSTKLRILSTPTTGLALSASAAAPTGRHDNGVATGSASYGAGAQWRWRNFALSGDYGFAGHRSASNNPLGESFSLPRTLRLNAGFDVPVHYWRGFDWITEADSVTHQGGSRSQHRSLFLVTGVRRGFSSGWGVSAGVAANVEIFSSEKNSGGIDGGNLSIYYRPGR